MKKQNKLGSIGVGLLIVGLAICASIFIGYADQITTDTPLYRYKYIGSGGNFGRLGTLVQNDVVYVSSTEAALLTDRSKWIPIDRSIAPNTFVSAGGAATLPNYDSQLYLLNVTTSVVVLPSVSHGREVIIKLMNVITGEVWVATAGQKIDGATNVLIGTSNSVYRYLSDGTNWWKSN